MSRVEAIGLYPWTVMNKGFPYVIIPVDNGQPTLRKQPGFAGNIRFETFVFMRTDMIFCKVS